LLRHGVTPATERKLFSGSSGLDPDLTPTGHQQAARAAKWIGDHGGADVVLSSPLQRTQQTASAVARELNLAVSLEPGLIETSFGDWDGFTFGQIQERWPTHMDEWLASTAVAPPGGESFDVVDQRVAQARTSILATHVGKTVVAVTHVTPIKLMAQ
jgi:probable phosphoglycerate mutase